MGDRANVEMRYEESLEDPLPPVFLYTHWGGWSLPLVVRAALRREERWDDPAYLARIIFCEMIKGDERSATGFGIASYMPDNAGSRPTIEIHPRRNIADSFVKIGEKTWTFEAFCLESNELAILNHWRGEGWDKED